MLFMPSSINKKEGIYLQVYYIG